MTEKSFNVTHHKCWYLLNSIHKIPEIIHKQINSIYVVVPSTVDVSSTVATKPAVTDVW